MFATKTEPSNSKQNEVCERHVVQRCKYQVDVWVQCRLAPLQCQLPANVDIGRQQMMLPVIWYVWTKHLSAASAWPNPSHWGYLGAKQTMSVSLFPSLPLSTPVFYFSSKIYIYEYVHTHTHTHHTFFLFKQTLWATIVAQQVQLLPMTPASHTIINACLGCSIYNPAPIINWEKQQRMA